MSTEEEIIEVLEKCRNEKVSPEVFYALLCERMAILNVDERKRLLNASFNYAKGDEKLLSFHKLSSGMAATFVAKFDESIALCTEAKQHFIQIGHHAGAMASATMISISHRSLGHLDKAQLYMKEAVDHLNSIEEGSDFYNFQTITCYQAGELCQEFKKYADAERLYMRGLSIMSENKELRGRLETGLGLNFMYTGDKVNAEIYFKKALRSIEGGRNKLLESKIYSDVGLFHLRNGEFEEALRNQLISLEIREKNNLLNLACTSYILLAETYLEMGEIKKAESFADKAIKRATELNTVIKLFEAHHILSRIYEKQGRISDAFEHYKLYHSYKDEVHNQDVVRRIEQLNSQHQIESSEKEKEIFRLRNVELKSALDEIHDSFVYASRIQRSLITSEKYIENSIKRMKKN